MEGISKNKQKAIAKLSELAQRAEEDYQSSDFFEIVLKKENADSWKYGGRTREGFVRRKDDAGDGQLSLFG